MYRAFEQSLSMKRALYKFGLIITINQNNLPIECVVTTDSDTGKGFMLIVCFWVFFRFTLVVHCHWCYHIITGVILSLIVDSFDLETKS